MQSVYEYKDYRKYLGDFYSEKKNKDPLYSYKSFSNAAGIKSPNYLTLVIDGRRNLTTTNIHQFARAMKLRHNETEFFETLVLFNQSKSSLEQAYYRNRLGALRSKKPVSIQKTKPIAVLKDWYAPGIMVLAHGRTLEAGIEKCKAELPLTEEAIREALESLIDIKLLYEAGGVLKIRAQQTTFQDTKGLNQFQERYLLAQLQKSAQAFKAGYINKKAKFMSHSLTIPAGALVEIQNELISFVENLTEKMDRQAQPENEELLQINVQIFSPKLLA